jgi:hypothetical protein
VATTAIIHELEKKDIYYQLSDLTPTVNAFRNNSVIVLDTHSNVPSEEFDRNIMSADAAIRGFWPIGLVCSDLSGVRGRQIAPIGTIRISNPERRHAGKSWIAHFSDYDQIIIAFIAEVVFVLVQQYQQFLSAETDLARLTHGLGANIDAAVKFANTVKEMLFLEREDTRIQNAGTLRYFR